LSRRPSKDAAGGTLKITSGGSTVFDGPLPKAISPLPLFN